MDVDCPEICPVRTIMEYERRKPEECKGPDKFFFLGVKNIARTNPDLHPIWFANCRMGRNTLQNNLKNAMVKLGVDVKAEHISATSAQNR